MGHFGQNLQSLSEKAPSRKLLTQTVKRASQQTLTQLSFAEKLLNFEPNHSHHGIKIVRISKYSASEEPS